MGLCGDGLVCRERASKLRGDEIIRFADRPNNHHHPARIAPSQSVHPSFRGAVINLSFLGRREPPTQEEAKRMGRKSGWSRSARARNRAGISEINKNIFQNGNWKSTSVSMDGLRGICHLRCMPRPGARCLPQTASVTNKMIPYPESKLSPCHSPPAL